MEAAKPFYTEGTRICVHGYTKKCGKSALITRLLAYLNQDNVALIASPEDTFFKYYKLTQQILGKQVDFTYATVDSDLSAYSKVIYKGLPTEGDLDIIYYISPPLLEDVTLGITDNVGRNFRAQVVETLATRFPDATVQFVSETDARLKTDELYLLNQLDWMTIREVERTLLKGTELTELRLILRDSSLSELEKLYKDS